MRIAFLGVRVLGHLNPMTTLARKLKARGHDVVFISVLDSEPYVRAAQLPFIPYCEKEMPLGLVRQEGEQLSKLQGQAALEFTIRVVASGLEAFFKNLPQTLLEARVDALVLDQVDTGLGLVPMHLGIPYVHVSNALHLDYSGNTPLCTFDWPHETTPEASRLSALIDEVLTNPEYRQNANNMKQVIAETNGLEKAADLLEQAFNLA